MAVPPPPSQLLYTGLAAPRFPPVSVVRTRAKRRDGLRRGGLFRNKTPTKSGKKTKKNGRKARAWYPCHDTQPPYLSSPAFLLLPAHCPVCAISVRTTEPCSLPALPVDWRFAAQTARPKQLACRGCIAGGREPQPARPLEHGAVRLGRCRLRRRRWRRGTARQQRALPRRPQRGRTRPWGRRRRGKVAQQRRRRPSPRRPDVGLGRRRRRREKRPERFDKQQPGRTGARTRLVEQGRAARGLPEARFWAGRR